MPRQTVDYSKLEGQAKIDAALNDIKVYLGSKKMLEVERIAQAELAAGKLNRVGFIVQMDLFVGLSGYPVIAWMDKMGFPPYTDEEIRQLEEM